MENEHYFLAGQPVIQSGRDNAILQARVSNHIVAMIRLKNLRWL